MLEFRIRSLLENKGIYEPYKWLRDIGISHHSCYKLLNKNNQRIRQEHITLICKQAWCTPNDLFEYNDTQKKLEAHHPLNNMREKVQLQLFEKLQKLSPERLKEMDAWLDGGDGT